MLCYSSYYGELSEKMKRIFQGYDISMQLTAANTSKNSLFQKAVKVTLCMKFAATQTLLVKMHILVRNLNHYSIFLDNTADLATMEMIQQSSNT